MGFFDSVMVPCPKCGVRSEFQTKSGDCNMDIFEYPDVPEDVLWDVNRHSPNTCLKCGTKFQIKFKVEHEIIEIT